MGGILSKTNIAHEVYIGQRCEAAISKASEGPLIVPPCDQHCLRMRSLPDRAPIFSLYRVFKGRFHQAGITQGGPVVEIGVVVLPATTPAGPAPAVVVAAEVVAAVAAPLAILEVVAADAPHPRVVAVTLQQGGAVGEEIGMGNAVVLQDDALLHLFEKPADRTDRSNAAALVQIGIEALDLARPVDLVLDHRAGGSHLLGFAGALGVRAVAGHIQTCGCHWADGIDHLAQGVGAAPSDQEEGGIGRIDIKGHLISKK